MFDELTIYKQNIFSRRGEYVIIRGKIFTALNRLYDSAK